ncbi:MAG: NAD(P)H-dependent oxidoreductase [Nannocystaceae bacterium]
MKLAILSGSHRPTSRVRVGSRFLADRSAPHFAGGASVIDLGRTPLPLWDEEAPDRSEAWAERFAPISAALAAADAIVVVAPEWNGMVPPALKNVFLLCSKGQLAHKPGLIVAVSSGRGGAYPVAELRMSSYKNTRLCYIPEQIILREIGTLLHDDPPTHENDVYLRQRIDYALALLGRYADALRLVRESGVVDPKSYPNGM